MSDVILYGKAPSTFTRSARIALEEKAADYTFEQDFDWRSEDFRQHHPFNRMPAMTHGGRSYCESLAICYYVDGAFEGQELVPADLEGQTRMLQWASAYNHYMVSVLVGNTVIELLAPMIFDRPANEEEIAEARPKALYYLDLLNSSLGDGYLAGQSYSIADIMVAPAIAYWAHMEQLTDDISSRSQLADWLTRLEARPAFRKTTPPLPFFEQQAAE
ncbi:glutathione S-transferase family protein [Rhodovibrionaceae bacterium A322]